MNNIQNQKYKIFEKNKFIEKLYKIINIDFSIIYLLYY